MIPRFFDIHGHINDARFDSDRVDIVARMRDENVWGIQVGTDYASSAHVVEMANRESEGLYAAIGIHPTDEYNEIFQEELFAELAKSSRVVAVGECGLDYARLEGDVLAQKERQKKLFEEQIDFAVKHNLPLMLHVRDSDKGLADAHRDILTLLAEKKKFFGDRLRGNVHFFAQTLDIAREYFALGFTISFTGVITFSQEYDEVIRGVPLDKIMSETDCPYVAPVPYRGKRNEPVYVEEVVKKIAEIRGEDFETIRVVLVENALQMFNIHV